MVAFVPPHCPVGTLGEKWTYPSDHLPVGCVLSDEETYEKVMSVVSWNILNSTWMGYIDNDTDAQGLRGSAIVTLHKQKEGAYTAREQKVAETVVKLLHRKGKFAEGRVLCLQECNRDMLALIQAKVQKSLGNRFKIVTSDHQRRDFGVMIYDWTTLEDPRLRVVHNVYSDHPDRFIMDATFTHRMTQAAIRVINTHLPGGENSKGPEELENYLHDHRADITQILVGDMNQTAKRIHQVFTSCHYHNYFILPTEYFTHINTKKEAVDYDQMHMCFGQRFEDEDGPFLTAFGFDLENLNRLDPEADALVHKLKLEKRYPMKHH